MDVSMQRNKTIIASDSVAQSQQKTIASIVERYAHQAGALLPILHQIQAVYSYIPKQAVPIIAAGLRQTNAEIHGVISFYHFFRDSPSGRYVLQVCRAEACQAQGGRDLEAHIKTVLAIDYQQNTPDKQFTLEPVYCLGNCACGPSIRVDNKIIGRVDAARFDALVTQLTSQVAEVS